MTKKISNKKNIQKKIAIRRIKKLFDLSEQSALSGKLTLSDRYTKIARKISMRYLVPIPKEFKHCFCKHCYSYLLPNVTCRIRINHGKKVIYCFKCKRFTRIPFSKHS
jgi:ribonuclease P protein subunit RPR2